ncbi:hypothetical protein COCNU_scaffold002811G000010 [Cocos nucifera]|nr:hypothetical protein [Cocos nucifera]
MEVGEEEGQGGAEGSRGLRVGSGPEPGREDHDDSDDNFINDEEKDFTLMDYDDEDVNNPSDKDIDIDWQTRGATKNEKLEEWRRAHPKERMRIIIPLGYVMPVEYHIRDSYVYKAYCDKASQSRSRLMVMHCSGPKSFAQYQYMLDNYSDELTSTRGSIIRRWVSGFLGVGRDM